MGIAVWLRPPRHLLALFAVVTLVPVVVLLWLGWKVIQQDRDLDGPRARARLERTATRVADGLTHEIHATIDALPSWVVSPPASIGQDAALIHIDGAGGVIVRGAPLPFVSVAPEAAEPTADVWDAGESAEVRGDFHTAAGIFGNLTSSLDPAVRAGALLRLAGDLRQLRQFDRALTAYRSLAAIDVRVAGEPAELIGRMAACEMLDALDRRDQLKADAAALAADLAKGRWALDRGTFEFRSNQLRAWVTLPQPGAELPLAAAMDVVWTDMARGGTADSGARSVWQNDRGMLVIWRRAPDGVAIFAASPEWVGREGGVQDQELELEAGPQR